MKIAVTADVHLTTRAGHPERYNALDNVLGQLAAAGIGQLIIAGDLFDRDQRNFGEFEALCGKPDYKDITIYIIRGNHDYSLRAKDIAAGNVRVIDEPEIVDLGAGSMPFLLIPYEDTGMGEKIAAMADSLEPGRWTLVGHGDYTGGLRAVNPHEKGIYMPLTRADLDRYKPARVFIGHIHKAEDFDSIHYPGSPCGLDINETGKRSFIILDTDSGSTTRATVNTDILWLNERFTLIPSDDEIERLETEIRTRIEEWGLSPADAAKARIRIQAHGYAQDRAAVRDALDKAFSGYTFHDENGVDISELETASDERCRELAQQVVETIETLPRPAGEEQPTNEQITLTALSLIYGDG